MCRKAGQCPTTSDKSHVERVNAACPELRTHRERAFRERAPGSVYVVPGARRGSNLGTHGNRLAANAGVALRPTFFTNLRGRCSDDLEHDGFAETAIDAWIGNTARRRPPEKRHQIRHHHRPSPAIGSHQPHVAPAKDAFTPVKTLKTKYPRQGSNL